MNKRNNRDVMYGDFKQLERLVKRRIRFLEYIVNKKDAPESAVQGHLRIVKKGTGFQNYFVSGKDDAQGKYMQKKDDTLARAIAQRDYDAKVRRAAEKELAVLYRQEKMAAGCVNAVYDNLVPGRKVLVKPVYLPDEECVAAWKDQPYTPVPAENASAENITKNGEQVRSKSEVLIANALADAGIPYLYEKPLQLFDRTVLPDFTILDLRRRKTIYWEHFGMMEQEKYKDKAYEKIISYQRAGYMMGVDLIATFESSSRPLGTKEIGRMIAGLLAP